MRRSSPSRSPRPHPAPCSRRRWKEERRTSPPRCQGHERRNSPGYRGSNPEWRAPSRVLFLLFAPSRVGVHARAAEGGRWDCRHWRRHLPTRQSGSLTAAGGACGMGATEPLSGWSRHGGCGCVQAGWPAGCAERGRRPPQRRRQDRSLEPAGRAPLRLQRRGGPGPARGPAADRQGAPGHGAGAVRPGHARTATSWAGVFPVRHKDGSTRMVEFRNMRLQDDQRDYYALGLATDQATLRQVERRSGPVRPAGVPVADRAGHAGHRPPVHLRQPRGGADERRARRRAHRPPRP